MSPKTAIITLLLVVLSGGLFVFYLVTINKTNSNVDLTTSYSGFNHLNREGDSTGYTEENNGDSLGNNNQDRVEEINQQIEDLTQADLVDDGQMSKETILEIVELKNRRTKLIQ